MIDWQPIDTAPRDGTRVLLWSSTDIADEDRSYIKSFCEGAHVVGAQIGSWCCDRHGWDKELIGQATHWMPLPEPPDPS